ncbi:short chain dehydrogenase/oxidoreductase, putative [Talaromyces stipitatus ATCC 10500]|uniref:Short chain dehydrogenase/oxidoreductase, putative n=1 Tax=Talaromyces stipitatus (strain ATCC 10500 / CBS 375.48 / QM 6759 / NRRL 1006) TaxID=441959 RepID=B8MQ46_TALSN|nr:short chain dehydrogenase/oxidoreductase, putative [Talaromyces stipitatus ATCC 10500]EED13072.1 short chain dehydrogenase/oxidoreductase, putative [Talaromyces stipitatus ATCC 10500]
MSSALSTSLKRTSMIKHVPRALSLSQHKLIPFLYRVISNYGTESTSTTPPTSATDHIQTKLPPAFGTKNAQRFREFNLEGRVIAVTGGGRGLGLSMAEALMEAGANVWCLDRLEKPDNEFNAAKRRTESSYGGSMHYARIDVRDKEHVDSILGEISSQNRRLDGIICSAGINHLHPAIGHSQKALEEVMAINYNGVFNSATAAAKQMFEHKCPGSILLVASMSGLIANKGMTSPVYNSSKAAVIQLGKCLAMEWGRHGIRVNSLSPGHIVTPMVEMVFEKNPSARATWEAENMLGRLASPEEFRGAALFALSDASSFMTGSNLIVDGGHTAW